MLETLVIGAAGGMLFVWAHLPGGLISGAMIAVGGAALAGRKMMLPPVMAQTVLVLLGISLGALVSRQLIQHMSAYPLTIGLLALATFLSTFGSSLYLQRVHGWDPTSALLAGSPGALSQITMLAVEKGADVAGIAVVQTIRVIILTAALPLVVAATGIASSAASALPTEIASPRNCLNAVLYKPLKRKAPPRVEIRMTANIRGRKSAGNSGTSPGAVFNCAANIIK